MHRDESLPWHVVCPQPWKRALETHVERSHQNALAHGMPSDGEPIELSIASDGSDPQVITVNQAGLTSTIHEHERLVHAPLPVEYRTFCLRGKLSLMVVKGTEQQKHFSEPCLWRRCLNSTTMEPFPPPCMRTFRIAPSYQFAKYLQQLNKLIPRLDRSANLRWISFMLNNLSGPIGIDSRDSAEDKR
ncbi:hypothetical protein TNCV_3846161 [Trichonephila clavipes]|nr:hypothetical protein TNCV_3846161 [Trichonephila clavipes]